jgi:hypothetical protein
VVTKNRVPVGSVLQMDFSLPPLLATGRGSRIKTRGLVVRSESDGFAVIADMGPGSLLHQQEHAYALGLETRRE